MGSSGAVNFGITTVTTTSAIPAPKTGLPQLIWKRVVSVSGAEVCDPDVGTRSRQAGHSAARRGVLRRPRQKNGPVRQDTDVRSAVIDTWGGYHTRTVTLAVATPPRPEHEIEYVDVCETTNDL